MGRRIPLALFFFFSSLFARAQAGVHAFNADFAFSGLLPFSWGGERPVLSHLGFDALVAFEYDSPISIPLRIEIAYLRVSPSRIAPTGELYRAWEGGRFALLSGYCFAPFPLGELGDLSVSLLAGGALTAADFTSTALAFAYPSILLEPRLALALRGSSAASPSAKDPVQGPWLALPIELMFRAGTYTLAPGLSLGWRYRLAALI